MSFLIKNGRIIDPANNLDQKLDILVDGENIKEVGENLSAAGAEVIDASGLVVAPGLIDAHVHLRTPGQEDRETVATGTAAAAAGGFSAVCCMPNTDPIIATRPIVEFINARAQKEAKSRVYVIASMLKDNVDKKLADIGEMIDSGAIAITNDGLGMPNMRTMRKAYEYCNIFDVPLVVHCEDDTLVEGSSMNEGAVATRYGLNGNPRAAEDMAVAMNAILAEYCESKFHVAHISSRGAVEIVRQFKARGVKITAEACPHHLFLCDEDMIPYDTSFKVSPPLRAPADRDEVVAGLLDGTIDMIATDHAPHTEQSKSLEFSQAPFGMVGLELALGVCYTELVDTKKLTLMQLIEKMSTAPARVFNLPGGSLSKDTPADIALIDPEISWKIDSSEFLSMGRATPFNGRDVKCKAVGTMVGGSFTYLDKTRL